MADASPARRLAGFRPRLSHGAGRLYRRQSRPTHRGRHAQAHRAFGEPRRRAVPVLLAAGQLHQHPVGAVEPPRLLFRRHELHHPGLHGLVRADLRADRLAADLARRHSLDRLERRTLCPRGRTALRAGAGQRKRRKHRPVRRRTRRAAPAQRQYRPRHHHHAPVVRRLVAADLDHLRLWLDRNRGADPGGLARLFPRRADHRRLDDGRRRLQPGAGLAALVRRPVPVHRGLARHAASRQRLQGRGRQGRRHRRGRRYHQARPPSRGHARLRWRQRAALRRPGGHLGGDGRDRGRRARADHRRIRGPARARCSARWPACGRGAAA